MAKELYMKLFVRTPMTHGALVKFVAGVLGGTVEIWTVICGTYELDVRPNDDADTARLKMDPNDFVYFPYSIEVTALEEQSLDEYLAIASRLMEAIASDGGGVVAACDWEHRLPGGGRLGLGAK